MKTLAGVFAYLWIGCFAAILCARTDLKPPPGAEHTDRDLRPLAVFVLAVWPVYLLYKSTSFIVDNMPSLTCGTCACTKKD